MADNRNHTTRRRTQSSASRSGRTPTPRVHGYERQQATPAYSDRLSTTSPDNRYVRKRGLGTPAKIGIVVVILAVIALIGYFAYTSYANSVSANLQKGVDDDLRAALVETDMAKEPFYVLLMGTDGSEERSNSLEYAGDTFRSDSIILARIDPVGKKATLVSVHRDTRVDMGEYGMQKLNAAHAVGGAAYAVKVVSDLAGVDISHYAEIDFDGFRELVDAIGGVEVDVPVTIDDYEAGGHVSAGYQTLTGEEALVLARSRNTYADVAADPDMMRAANQRLVLSAIARKVLSSDIATIANSVRIASNYIKTDMSMDDIVGVAQAMRGIDPDTDIYTAMQPVTSEYSDDLWWAITDEEAWKTMMDREKAGLPPTEETEVDEATGTIVATAGDGPVDNSGRKDRVSVRNGTSTEGLAQEATSVLRAHGYENVMFGNAGRQDYAHTEIVYRDTNYREKAENLQLALGQGELVYDDTGDYIFEGQVLVLVGADWHKPPDNVFDYTANSVALKIGQIRG